MSHESSVWTPWQQPSIEAETLSSPRCTIVDLAMIRFRAGFQVSTLKLKPLFTAGHWPHSHYATLNHGPNQNQHVTGFLLLVATAHCLWFTLASEKKHHHILCGCSSPFPRQTLAPATQMFFSAISKKALKLFSDWTNDRFERLNQLWKKSRFWLRNVGRQNCSTSANPNRNLLARDASTYILDMGIPCTKVRKNGSSLVWSCESALEAVCSWSCQLLIPTLNDVTAFCKDQPLLIATKRFVHCQNQIQHTSLITSHCLSSESSVFYHTSKILYI